MEENFNEKIRNSFTRVREDIENLKREMQEIKNTLPQRNNDILMLKEQIKTQNELISKLQAKIENISTGNERVRVDTHSSVLILDDAQKKLVSPITVEKFRHITDREFSVFMAVYQLEEENGAVTYNDVSRKLGLGITNTRNYVNDLINRGYPIYGERQFHRKIKFRILPEFRRQNMISEVLSLREAKNIKQ